MQFVMTDPVTIEASSAGAPRGSRAVEQVYHYVKGAILAGDYSARSPLREAAVAEKTGVSRTPVREAFRRLGAEGWLEITPNAGVRVADWSLRDIEEVFEVRAMIEPRIAERAATRATPEQIDRLGELADFLSDLINRPVNEIALRRAGANSEFHDILVCASDSRRLGHLLGMVVDMPVVMWTYRNYTSAEMQRSAAHHHEIVAAIRARDGEWAASAMRSHILAARQAVLDRVESSDLAPPMKTTVQ